MNHLIRPEKSFERCSQGAQIVRAIEGYLANQSLGPVERLQAEPSSETICEEFDLTTSEWFYWLKAVEKR